MPYLLSAARGTQPSELLGRIGSRTRIQRSPAELRRTGRARARGSSCPPAYRASSRPSGSKPAPVPCALSPVCLTTAPHVDGGRRPGGPWGTGILEGGLRCRPPSAVPPVCTRGGGACAPGLRSLRRSCDGRRRRRRPQPAKDGPRRSNLVLPPSASSGERRGLPGARARAPHDESGSFERGEASPPRRRLVEWLDGGHARRRCNRIQAAWRASTELDADGRGQHLGRLILWAWPL